MINDKINELQDQERVVRQAAKQIRRQKEWTLGWPKKNKKLQFNAKNSSFGCNPVLPDEVIAERFAESSGAKRHAEEKADRKTTEKKEKKGEAMKRTMASVQKQRAFRQLKVCVCVWGVYLNVYHFKFQKYTHLWNINIPMTTAADITSAMTHIKQYSSGLCGKRREQVLLLCFSTRWRSNCRNLSKHYNSWQGKERETEIEIKTENCKAYRLRSRRDKSHDIILWLYSASWNLLTRWR